MVWPAEAPADAAFIMALSVPLAHHIQPLTAMMEELQNQGHRAVVGTSSVR